MSYRVKLAIFALVAALVLFILDTAYQGLNTLRRLDIVEAERDQWQRPTDIIHALNLRRGGTVVDLGCGSGYFALKLASEVGPAGTVYAVDIRRLPLAFLWIRTLTRHLRHVSIVLAQPDDPHLPSGASDAVLLANTYHELANPGAILDQVFQSLVPTGRLVIVEPMRTEHGELPTALVEEELRRHNFDIVSREDQFVGQPVRGAWWLIIARRP